MPPFAQKALGRAFSIRRQELSRVLPLASAYGLVLASIYVLKPARNALFLAQLGIGQIPYVLLLVAAVGGVFALIYGRLTRSLSIEVLVQRTFLGLIGCLIGFRLLFEGEPAPWVFYAFYVWVALYGLLTTSLVWLLANGVFDSREARRVFGFIGTGGIGGAIVGGTFTGALAERLGTENLLLVCIGLLAVCLVLFWFLPSTSRAAATPRSEGRPLSGLGAIAASPLLKNLALVTGLIAAVAVIVDVQFNAVVDRAFTGQDEKAAFFGSFFAVLSGFSFVFQLVITPVVLRVLGVGVALTILPAALGLGSMGLLILPGLLAGIAAKSADGGFRHSVHKAASEVLFLPVPSDVKKQSKLFMDTTVDTTATGIGALSVLLLTERLGVSYAALSFVSVPLIVAALVVVRRVRASYVDAFRQALETRRLDLGQLRTSLAEAGALDLLQPALRSTNKRQVIYALDLLSGLRQRALVPVLEGLLEHPSPEVRRRALTLRAAQSSPISVERLDGLSEDPDVELRASALVLQVEQHPEVGTQRLVGALEEGSPKRRAAALDALAIVGPEVAGDRLTPERVQRWLDDPSFAPLLGDLARALGRLSNPSFDPILERLLDGAEISVVRAAIEGIALGRSLPWLPWLFEQLDVPELRSAVQAALVEFGADAMPLIEVHLDQPEASFTLRRALPRVLGRIPTQASVEILMLHLEDPDRVMSRSVHRALVKLRTGYDELRFDRRRLNHAIEAAARRHFEAGRALRALDGALDDTPVAALLLRSLREARREEAALVLDLLVLRHSPDDIARVRRGLTKSAPDRARASALELLENVVDARIREAVLSVLDDVDPVQQHRRALALFGGTSPTPDQGLLQLLDSPNAWLRACAVHAAADRADATVRRRLEDALEDPSPFVRQSAARALAA